MTELEKAVRALFAEVAGEDSTGDPAIQLSDPIDVLHEIAEHIKALEVLADMNMEDAARWGIVKSGLFVTPPNENGDVEVVYQNAWLDEVAQDMYDELPKTIPRPLRKGQVATPEEEERWSKKSGIVRDITPVVDRAIEITTTERIKKIMGLIGNEVMSSGD
jgi:hypothetical protein